ncbi:hypothetical protein [Bradyrhizobium iriomotense]|uniref:DUF3551 domain-containing protein n=1 Tax=Bradyrhizobium iriomotense TaxID=441950 RepID=A0ABQ6AWK9_9BRAD|nr:hypothetical protein [Bradyrhizobium iriomotense]GLR86390.1 hypothetical protein GCM10007857_31010 [Bradyrhizobium iriomotense]
MTRLKLVSAAALTAMILPLATSSPSLAAGRGPGWCTPSSENVVGAAGPAMSGGQLMAGVGQCRNLSSWHHTNSYGYWGRSYGYGYSEPGWGAPAYVPDEY